MQKQTKNHCPTCPAPHKHTANPLSQRTNVGSTHASTECPNHLKTYDKCSDAPWRVSHRHRPLLAPKTAKQFILCLTPKTKFSGGATRHGAFSVPPTVPPKN